MLKKTSNHFKVLLFFFLILLPYLQIKKEHCHFRTSYQKQRKQKRCCRNAEVLPEYLLGNCVMTAVRFSLQKETVCSQGGGINFRRHQKPQQWSLGHSNTKEDCHSRKLSPSIHSGLYPDSSIQSSANKITFKPPSKENTHTLLKTLSGI